MDTILISGGTGLVGTQLSEFLTAKGYQVIHLSRKANLSAKFPAYRWDLNEGYLDPEAIKKSDHIIHLAGANVASGLWTKSYRKAILDSRIKSTQLLTKSIQENQANIKSFIGASAIGFYGNSGDVLQTETSPLGKGFLAEVCLAWEQSYKNIEALKIPCSIVRIGIVLSDKGGALDKIKASFKIKAGGYFGNGQMYMSWIHLQDLCALFGHVLSQASPGIYNAVAPNPSRNKAFIQGVSKALGGRNLIMPIPAFGLKLSMGEMSSILLNSNLVSSEKVEASGFKFQFPELAGALENLLSKK